MSTLRIVLGDQLTRGLSSLRDYVPGDTVLMMEVAEETTYVRHHKRKIAFILSAMRHHAAALREAGWTVDYVRLDDPENSGSFTGEVARALARHGCSIIRVTQASEWRVQAAMEGWAQALGVSAPLSGEEKKLLDAFEAGAIGREGNAAPVYADPAVYARMFHEEGVRFAKEIGLPENSRIALELGLHQESGGRYDAKAKTTSAFGGMQVIDETWNTLLERYPEHFRIEGISADKLREHPFAQLRAAQLTALEDLNRLKRSMPERDFEAEPLNAGETYMLHWLGGPRATKVLQAENDTPFKDVVPESVIANHKGVKFHGKPIAEWTVGDAKDWTQSKMEQHLGKAASIAAQGDDALDLLLGYYNAANAGKGFAPEQNPFAGMADHGNKTPPETPLPRAKPRER